MLSKLILSLILECFNYIALLYLAEQNICVGFFLQHSFLDQTVAECL